MNIDDDRIPIDAIQEIEDAAWWEAKYHLVIGFVVGVELTTLFFLAE